MRERLSRLRLRLTLWLGGDWEDEVSSAYVVAAFLALAFAGFTGLVAGPLVGLDTSLNIRDPPEEMLPLLYVLDRMGGRLIALPILGVVLWWIWRRTGRVRPLLVSVTAVLGMIFVVGCLKLAFGRGKPGTLEPDFEFLSGSLAYPSGHTSNVVLIYGLIPYLLATYAAVRPAVTRALVGLVCFLSLWMVSVSVALSWHWFADLWGGLLTGGISLALAAGIDHAIPRDIFEAGVRRGLLRIPGYVRGGRTASDRDGR